MCFNKCMGMLYWCALCIKKKLLGPGEKQFSYDQAFTFTTKLVQHSMNGECKRVLSASLFNST